MDEDRASIWSENICTNSAISKFIKQAPKKRVCTTQIRMTWHLKINGSLSDFFVREASTMHADGMNKICDARHANPKKETPNQNFFLSHE